ncbi:MAG TPA: filamentous hemagglutinin N-terminal domain-containing protein [Myxococcota bacterium]|nr:filamentous hemagglutinin N-terminal domain-containing protein [Myxococcota bacterium]
MSFLRHILVLVLSAAFAVGPAAPYAFADPKQAPGGNGKGTLVPTGTNTWDVNVHNGAIIQYSSFDVAVDQIVRFNGLDNGADVRVLNRILSTSATHIDGTLSQSGGNIHVYLVNPAGVFFGAGAQVNVTALQAAAGNLSDDDFSAGRDHFTGLSGPVENAGKITAGSVALAGKNVSNPGTIDAGTGGTVVLVSGGNVLIRPNGIDRVPARDDSVDNSGTITGHQVDLAGSAVTNSGTLTATDVPIDPNTADPGSVTLNAGRHLSHLDDGDRFSGGAGTVENQNGGTISGSQVRMVGGDVKNAGTVTGGEAVLAGGRNVRLGTDGDDKYKTMTGSVDNTGQVIANAVSMVGGQVTNGGQVTAQGGWIVIAAGHDVFIGRDGSNQGLLLRVEGGAKALDPTKTGVSNTGTLDAGSSHDPNGVGKITLGAADLYGQAIFNTGAIEARRVALQADNGGDVALGGQIHTHTLDATFAGAKPGELHGTPGGTQTVNADTVNLTATDAKGNVTIGKGLAFRGDNDPTGSADNGPAVVSVTQQGQLNTSNLKGLDIGANRGVTNLQLDSIGGNVVVDDKTVVNGTDLDLQGRAIRLLGTDPLTVEHLLLNSVTTFSDGDIVATGTGGIDASTNLFFTTRPGAKKNPTDPANDVLLSAHLGKIDVAGDIVTSNGGGLRIEGQDVEIGSFNDQTGSLNSGTVQSSGGVQSHIAIGFTDDQGVQQTHSVTLNAINSFGARANEKDKKVPGGDVVVNANGPVTIRGAIDASGESNASKVTPDESGGSVTINAGDTLTVGSVQTGGGDAPVNGAAERGAITLTAPKIVLGGNLSAQSTPAGSPNGERDRTIQVNGELELAADTVSLLGGNVTVTGPTHGGSHTDPNTGTELPFLTGVTIGSSGQTEIGSMVGGIESLTVSSRGGDVISHGDIVAPAGVIVAFNTPGTGQWRTGGETIQVSSNQTLVSATDIADPKSATAALSIDPNIHFLTGIPDPTVAGRPPTFQFTQDAPIDPTTTAGLFTAGRFGPTLQGQTLGLTSSRGGVTLDANARAGMQGADVKIVGTDFAATELVDGPDFSVGSLALSVQHAIDVNFDVDAATSIAINSGTDGKGEGITLESTLRSDSISLAASDGEGGSTKGVITFAGGALRASNGDAAKQVTLTQDSDFSSASVPNIFGTPSDPSTYALDLALESLDGTVTLANPAQFAPSTKLTLLGTKAVDLGTAPIQLGALSATTNGDLDVTQTISTAPGGSIVLHAGANDGTGTLTIGSQLTSSEISLVAGNGSTGGGKVVFDTGARFAGVSPSSPLTDFTLVQSSGITELPDFANQFSNLAPDLLLTLQSTGQSVKLSDPNALSGFGLIVAGKTGVELKGGDFNLASLDATGTINLDGSVFAAGDVGLHGAVTLSSAATVATQNIHAGGNLVVDDAMTRQNNGDIDLQAGKALTVAGVETAHLGGAIDIRGHDSVTAGELQSWAGVTTDSGHDVVGGNVNVTSAGNISVAAVDSTGASGTAAARGSDATNGGGAGSITIQVDPVANGGDPAATITVGKLNASGGAGGNPSTDRPTGTTGGAGGSIELEALGGILLGGDILADGGLNGVVSTATTVVSTRPPDRGTPGAVTLTGPVRLKVDTDVTAGGNNIHGGTVHLTGDVTPLSDPNVDPNATSLSIIAYTANGLQLDGSVTAGNIDLEQRGGTLQPSASQATALNGNTIRLAASDGQGGDPNGMVNVDAFTFHGVDGASAVSGISLEQDRGFGGATGTAIPSSAVFAGNGNTNGGHLAYGLISHDGSIELSAAQAEDLGGTNLTLAANVGAVPIQVHGDLSVTGLTLGTTTALATTGGSTEIDGSLLTGSFDPDLQFQQALSMSGDLTVHGDAAVLGSSAFTGATSQTLRADGTLFMTGLTNVKSQGGDLTFDSDHISLGDGSQSFGDGGGTLHFTSSLVKAHGDLALGGQVPFGDPNSGVVIDTTPLPNFPGRAVAIATLDGSVIVNAATAADPNAAPGNASPGTGTYDIGGDILAFGDVTLSGQAKLTGQSSYTFQALRKADGTGGTLTVGGIQSASGPVTLRGEGPRGTPDQPDPSAVKLSGDFAVSQLEVDGKSEITAKTAITGQQDVTFDGEIQGAGDLSVVTKGAVVLGDDVATTGAFAVGGNQGVRFVEDSDVQTIEAASIALGNGATGAQQGLASLSRTGDETSGDLVLRATKGDVSVASGQRMIVNGNLQVTAAEGIVLADTAALKIQMTSSKLSVHGGSTVAANSISTTAKPAVAGGGGATFAVPTRSEISQNVPSDNVIVRGLNAAGRPLTSDDLVGGIFPTITGAAIFDYARDIPEALPAAPQTRPAADPMALAAALESRPLWAEELVAYLDRRSVENPGTTGKPMEAEHLPPVGARPGEPLTPADVRVRSAAAENAVALYRQVFRPDLRRDPESGVIDAPSQTPAIRAAFQQPIDALRRARHGQEVTSAEIARLLETDAKYTDARRYREQLGALLDVGARALTPEQQPRFRNLVLAEVAPYGISPAEFDSLFTQ